MKNNLTEYFKNTVYDFPDKIAIDDNQVAMSFSELNKVSDKIEHEIVSKTKGTSQPIAVYLTKSRWSVASFIGVFKKIIDVLASLYIYQIQYIYYIKKY